MENNIKEFEKFEKNFFIRLINNYNEYNYEESKAQTLINKLNEKIQEIQFIKKQIKMLKFESLGLNEEITRLVNEIEIKALNERYK